MFSKTTARPRCFSIAAQNGDAASRRQWFVERFDHVAVVAGRVGRILADRPAVDSEGVVMNQIAEFTDHRRQAARIVEVFHEIFAGRHEVDQTGEIAAELIPIHELEVDPQTSGYRQQVDDGIGRAGCASA
jgi:hypothetical protein